MSEETYRKIASTTGRSALAGRGMAKAITEVAHLMYQNKTAGHFYQGLMQELIREIKARKIDFKEWVK